MITCRRVESWFGLVLCALLSATAYAQSTARVSGTVRDEKGQPVALARVSSGRNGVITDSSGRFSLGGLAAGSDAAVAVRRLGYSPLDTMLALASGRDESLTLVIEALPHDLPGVTSNMDEILRTRLPDFYRHRSSGTGNFFDRRDIDARHPQFISDLFRVLPGMRVVPGYGGRSGVRTNRSGGGRDCPPDVWIDGIRAAGLAPDDISIHDVEALELYRGPAGLPPELNDRFGRPACGVIVIWTRLPG